jgi:hypothetical protein
METDSQRPLEHGDRVTAATDLETTQGLHIDKGAEGTVAEDRGSKLVVFFDDHDAVVSLTEPNLVKIQNQPRRPGDGGPTAA